MYRFARVPFKVVSSPFLLAAVIRHHLQHQQSRLAHSILQNLYVDNVLIGTEDSVSTKRSYAKAKRIFADAFMRLRKFSTNNQTIFQKMLPSDRCSDSKLSVLGLRCNPVVDLFQLQIKGITSKVLTKRAILSFISTQYDSLGLIAPALLPWKVLCQKL